MVKSVCQLKNVNANALMESAMLMDKKLNICPMSAEAATVLTTIFLVWVYHATRVL